MERPPDGRAQNAAAGIRGDRSGARGQHAPLPNPPGGPNGFGFRRRSRDLIGPRGIGQDPRHQVRSSGLAGQAGHPLWLGAGRLPFPQGQRPGGRSHPGRPRNRGGPAEHLRHAGVPHAGTPGQPGGPGGRLGLLHPGPLPELSGRLHHQGHRRFSFNQRIDRRARIRRPHPPSSPGLLRRGRFHPLRRERQSP